MKTMPPSRTSRSEHGFTLVEMIGVLAVIAILASLLVPRVFQAINDSKINSAASSLNTVKSAVNEHYARFGRFGTATGAAIAVVAGTPSENWDRTSLVAGGFMEKPLALRIGNGDIGYTDPAGPDGVLGNGDDVAGVEGTRLRLVNVSALTADEAPVDADLDTGAYDLDGSGGATDNDIVGAQLVVEAVINGVLLADAQDLNNRIDGTTLGTTSGDDALGRVKYKAQADGTANVRVYVAHR